MTTQTTQTSQAPNLSVAPFDPARVPDIVAALEKVGPLQGLEEHEYLWLAEHGSEVFAEPGAVVFREGDPAHKMSILLKGEVHVRRERVGPAVLFIGRSGQITGLLPFSRMKSYGGTGVATIPSWGLEIDKALFPEMLAAIPSMADRSVSILLDRVREVTRIEQQSEKLTALGKLAGNLAHELNNPASAAQRSAAGMLEELRIFGHERFRLGKLCLAEVEVERILDWEKAILAKAAPQGSPHEVQQTSREDQILDWLRRNHIQDAWHVTPELAEQEVTPEQLDELRGSLAPDAVSVVLSQMASSMRAQRIADAMLNSTARIFDLISAIKDYSYMDQAPIQEVDVPQSLETTLAMLGSRLEFVEVIRDYEPNLPTISAYGSELNQVWMALIENSLDAIRNHGQIRLRVCIAGDLMRIEVWDNGPGIPSELKARIFEPFFTTKAPGSGLGLGLDTVNRIVRLHRGFVNVHSSDGYTCFEISLPLQQLQAY